MCTCTPTDAHGTPLTCTLAHAAPHGTHVHAHTRHMCAHTSRSLNWSTRLMPTPPAGSVRTGGAGSGDAGQLRPAAPSGPNLSEAPAPPLACVWRRGSRSPFTREGGRRLGSGKWLLNARGFLGSCARWACHSRPPALALGGDLCRPPQHRPAWKGGSRVPAVPPGPQLSHGPAARVPVTPSATPAGLGDTAFAVFSSRAAASTRGLWSWPTLLGTAVCGLVGAASPDTTCTSSFDDWLVPTDPPPATPVNAPFTEPQAMGLAVTACATRVPGCLPPLG